jgi:hypothetical protein
MAKIEIAFDEDTAALMTRLCEALEDSSAGDDVGEETGEKPAKKKAAAKKAKKKDGPTIEDVRGKLKEHAALEGKESAITILNDTGGAASVGELDEDKYQAVIDKCDED